MTAVDSIKVSEHAAVACPFCGLACDDLRVRIADGKAEVVEKGCARSITLFGREPPGESAPAFVDGKPATLVEAIARATQILRQSNQPVVGGLATDVAGMRAALELAEHLGAVVDHMGSR